MTLEAIATQLVRSGFAIVPDVLDPARVEDARVRLWEAAKESERRGVPTRSASLDPNDHNVRVYNLLDLDPLFVELIQHPLAIDVVASLIGRNFLISNFTANIALPGSESMKLHSDQSIVIPEPWLEPWAINIIWCLNEVHSANGATLYLPGSHRFSRVRDVPRDAMRRLKPFEAKAGSIIAMDGRLWHTSGANITRGKERALLFGYYARDFIRPQTNWNAALSEDTIADLSPQMRLWLGLGVQANINLATALVSSEAK